MGGSLILAVVLAVAVGIGGWCAPTYYVELKRRERMEKIDKQMPDMIDLLVVTIEAGLGILASMRVASESMSDPLGQELRLTLQEQRMGLSVGQAIESLGRRADSTNVRIFVRAITQGERLGVSIGTTMRNISIALRRLRISTERFRMVVPMETPCGTSPSRCASGAGRWRCSAWWFQWRHQAALPA